MERSCGILMPVFSLPSPYGIGTLGREAYRFADFLKAAGRRAWQMLPLGPTSYGDSPYQSISTAARNPYVIDLDMLVLLERSEIARVHWGDDAGRGDTKRYTLIVSACWRRPSGAALSETTRRLMHSLRSTKAGYMNMRCLWRSSGISA